MKQQILDVEAVLRMLLKRERVSGLHRNRVRRASHNHGLSIAAVTANIIEEGRQIADLRVGGFLLQIRRCAVSVIVLLVAVGPERALGVGGRAAGGHRFVLDEAVVPGGVFPGYEGGARREIANDKIIKALGVSLLRRVAEGTLYRTIAQFARYILQREGVVIAGVLEIVENSMLLHQPRDKGKVRLAVLRAILQRRVGARRIDSGADIVGAQHRLDHINHGLVLKDARIRVEGQSPKIGNDGRAIGQELVVATAHLKAGDDPVHIALCAGVVCLNSHGDFLADDLFGVDGGLSFGEELKLIKK